MPNASPLLVAQCQSMSILLDQRLGPEENPWSQAKFKFVDMEDHDLIASKKLMHELLYSPPLRE